MSSVHIGRVALAMLGALAGCGEGSPGVVPEGAGGAPGGAGVVSNGCPLPPGARVLAAARTYAGGSVVYRIVADDSDVFFSTVDEIWSVSRAAGGVPRKLYPPTSDPALVTPPFWIRGSELLVSPRATKLDWLPRQGGPVTTTRTLAIGYTGALDGRADLWLDAATDTLYGKADRFGLSGETDRVTYWKYTVATGVQTALLTDSPVGGSKIFVQGPGHLYTSTRGPDDNSAHQLVRIPVTGGPPERVAVAGSFHFNVRGVDATHLFLDATPWPASTDDLGGIYRLPLAGGAPEKIVASFNVFNAQVDVVSLPERVVIQTFHDFWQVPHGGGAASKLASASTTCQVHGFTAHGTQIFFGLYQPADATMQLIELTSP